MTSEGLGEMFEGDYADMCADKFPLVSMGAEQGVKRAQTGKQDPIGAGGYFFFYLATACLVACQIIG